MNATFIPAGELLRDWRQRRRMSQLDLALEADISSKHLSFVESGRSQPSREMILRLCETLAVPLRERNGMLLAAGYAPVYPQRAIDHPAFDTVRHAVEQVLKGHEPYPALAIDRHWHLMSANRVLSALIAGAAPALIQPPVNVLRLSLHPEGLAPRIANFWEWRTHLLARLRQQIAASADATLAALHQELAGLPLPAGHRADHTACDREAIAVPLRLASEAGMLSLLSTTTVFGTPVDVTLAELAIEAFFPADAETATRLAQLCPAS